MNTKAPAVSETRWKSMGKVSDWIKSNRVDVLAYLYLKKLSMAPGPSCWIVMMFIHKISAEAPITFRRLEGLATLVSKQSERLKHLNGVYARFFNTAGPLSD